jgi:hypothetical protein
MGSKDDDPLSNAIGSLMTKVFGFTEAFVDDVSIEWNEDRVLTSLKLFFRRRRRCIGRLISVEIEIVTNSCSSAWGIGYAKDDDENNNTLIARSNAMLRSFMTKALILPWSQIDPFLLLDNKMAETNCGIVCQPSLDLCGSQKKE